MQSRIEKWGDSLALRIPETLAVEAGLQDGSLVDVLVENGKLVVRSSVPSLEELVTGITDENRHDEIDWGPPQGREVW